MLPNVDAAFVDWCLRAYEFLQKHEKDPKLRKEVRDLLPGACSRGEAFILFRKGETVALGIFAPGAPGILVGQYILVAPKARGGHALLSDLLSRALAAFPSSSLTYERRAREVLVTPTLTPRITRRHVKVVTPAPEAPRRSLSVPLKAFLPPIEVDYVLAES